MFGQIIDAFKAATVFDLIIWLVKITTIAILAIVWWQARRQRSLRRERWAVLGLFAVQLIGVIGYYAAWWHRLASSPLTQTLLWPRSNFLVPHVMTDLTSIIVGWSVSAIIFLFLGWFFLRRGQGRMLDGADVRQLFLLSAAVGWPGMFIAMGMVFVLAVVLMFLLVLLRKKSLQDRLIISPVILPAAMVTILFQDQLLALTHLTKIGF